MMVHNSFWVLLKQCSHMLEDCTLIELQVHPTREDSVEKTWLLKTFRLNETTFVAVTTYQSNKVHQSKFNFNFYVLFIPFFSSD